MKMVKGNSSLTKLANVTMNVSISSYEPYNLSKNYVRIDLILICRSKTAAFWSGDHYK